MEKTLVIIKPDGVQRRFIGEIINRFERKGLKIVALKMIKVTQKQAETLYAVHKKKPFYSQPNSISKLPDRHRKLPDWDLNEIGYR